MGTGQGASAVRQLALSTVRAVDLGLVIDVRGAELVVEFLAPVVTFFKEALISTGVDESVLIPSLCLHSVVLVSSPYLALTIVGASEFLM